MFTVAFLGVTAGVQMSDRGLQAILLSAIQASFAVGDSTIGALQGLAGVLVGSAIAIPVARLADRFPRRNVLLGLIAFWSSLTALSALAPSFPLFFIGRAASGVTEFAMIPIVYSMIPDLAPERHRVMSNLGFAALMAAGASAGFYYGEAIVDAAQALLPGAIEPWRKAYLLLAAAGLPLLALGMATRDPPRHVTARDIGTGAALLPFLRERWRAVGLFVGVAGSLMIAVQALNPLIALALRRRFGAELGMIGHAMGWVTLATSIGCLPVAGFLDAHLGRRFGVAARPIIMGCGAVAAIPCAALLLAADSVGHALWAVASFLFVTCTANALVPTVLQDLTPASLRARSFAIWSFVVSVFCAIGPMAAGLLSDFMFGGRLLTAIAVTAIPPLILSALCAARSIAPSDGLRLAGDRARA
ncbi:MAG: MFS transporter [Sphingomonas bacterium]